MTATIKPTSEPQVPGPGFRYPVPRAVAMANAMRGFSAAGAGEAVASVDGFIVLVPTLAQRAAIRLGDFFFVKNRFGDDVLFCRPRAQVQQAAALRAEREFRILGGIHGRFANRAFVCHREEVVVPPIGIMS